MKRFKSKRANRRFWFTGRLSRGDSSDSIRDYLESLDCAHALSAWILFRENEHRSLVTDFKVKPEQFNDSDSFRRAYAAVKFFSKTKNLSTGIDTDKVALEAAELAEVQNRQTNHRLRHLLCDGVSHPLNSKLFEAQCIIADVLGDLPPFDPTEATLIRGLWFDRKDLVSSFEDVGWSGGRTTSSWGDTLPAYHKYGSRLDVTASARLKASYLLRDSPWWSSAVLQADGPSSLLKSAFSTVRGNVMLVVPKNAKTGRTIGYEPHVNIRLQLSVGRYLRKRLSKRGVDLSDQTVNQKRACRGSLNNSLSTIDLKMASDTLSTELVKQLLPFDWYCLLDDLRSKETLWPDGSWRLNHKFSSMGNGFTFELESLVFYALCMAICRAGVSVYGDDIVIPSKYYAEVVELLEFCGFKCNMEKSFHDGPFRESCGGDYYLGDLVTPTYLRAVPSQVRHLVSLHNSIFRTFNSSSSLAMMRRRVPYYLGPPGYGDGHYHVYLEESKASRSPYSLDGWDFKTTIPIFRDLIFSSRDGLALPQALCASLGPRGSIDLDRSLERDIVGFRDKKGMANFCWPSKGA